MRSLVKYFSTLEEKFRISAQPCNILYFVYTTLLVDSIERERWLTTQTPGNFAIHLPAISVEFAPENAVIFAGINE